MTNDAPDPRLVFAKTPLGSDEMTQRALGLSNAARRVLILVDGRRRLLDITPFVRPGEIDGIVEELQALGLIVLAGIADALTDEELREREARQRETLRALQRALEGAFARELGKEGLVLDARVRDCVDLDVLRRLLRGAVETVERKRGQRCAERLLRTIRAQYARFSGRPKAR